MSEEINLAVGAVNLPDGSQQTIDESCEEVKTYLSTFPTANLENAVAQVTERRQRVVDANEGMDLEALLALLENTAGEEITPPFDEVVVEVATPEITPEA